MIARNRWTGRQISGALHVLTGRVDIKLDSFTREANGGLTYKEGEESSAFWENGRKAVRAGDIVLLDDQDNEVLEGDVTLEGETSEAGPRNVNPATLTAVGRKTSFTDNLSAYELVDRMDGTGRGLFMSFNEASRNTRTGERVAEATYTLGGEPKYCD